MTAPRKDNIFCILEPQGAFSTGESVARSRPFSSASRCFAKQLAEANLTTRYRMVREQIYKFLQISSFAEIDQLLGDETRRKEIKPRAYGFLANMFGISGDEQACVTAVTSYFHTADGVTRYLRNTVLAPYAAFLEMTNNLYTINNPIELLLLVFDDRYHQKVRFEAKRKLVLMSLAAAIAQRERETDVEEKFTRFLAACLTFHELAANSANWPRF